MAIVKCKEKCCWNYKNDDICHKEEIVLGNVTISAYDKFDPPKDMIRSCKSYDIQVMGCRNKRYPHCNECVLVSKRYNYENM